MPELVPTWRRLTEMVDDEHAGAVLALWNPPAFLTGCSQAAVPGRSPALVRNYDWDYRLYDGVVMRTAYGGRRVLGMGDCLWGLLDGVNDAGIAVSAHVRRASERRDGVRHTDRAALRAAD